MNDGALFFSKLCDKHYNRLSIPGKEIAEFLGDCEMMLVCTSHRFLAAAPLDMSADINSQTEQLCRFYDIPRDAAEIHTFKIDKESVFSPPLAWMISHLKAEKIDLYILSKPAGAAEDKKFCVEVITPENMVSQRVHNLYITAAAQRTRHALPHGAASNKPEPVA
jgi:hypothetical protein